MYTFEITENKTEMIILLNEKPVYRSGYHRSMNHQMTQNAFDDCVSRLKNQLI